MSRIKNILVSLRDAPGYTLMRSVGRFSSLRWIVAASRRTMYAQRTMAYLAECESRMDQTLFPSIDRQAFVRELKEQGVAYGLRLPKSVVDEILEYAKNATTYA